MANKYLRILVIKVVGKTDTFTAIAAAATAGEQQAFPLKQKRCSRYL